jgi:hypothetical protein
LPDWPIKSERLRRKFEKEVWGDSRGHLLMRQFSLNGIFSLAQVTFRVNF